MRERCGAIDGFYICQRKPGHSGSHQEEKHEWHEICGAHCPDANGGPDFICQLPPHKLYKGAKHRDGAVSWTQGGADRVATEIAAKKVLK